MEPFVTPSRSSVTPGPSTRQKTAKKAKRVGKGVKQRKHEKHIEKMNAQYLEARNQRIAAWQNSFRTDIIVNTFKQQHHYTSLRNVTIEPSCSEDDILLELRGNESLIGISTTESILHDLPDPPALPDVSYRVRTPQHFYSNPMSVACLPMDASETHSLNMYFSYEELLHSKVPPNTSASICKSDQSAIDEFPMYEDNNIIQIDLHTFDGDITKPFSRDSLLIYAPDLRGINEDRVFNYDEVVAATSYDHAPTVGNKLCLITSNHRLIRKWYKLRSIGFIYPALMWIMRTDTSFPPENVLLSSLLVMIKGYASEYLDFVT